MATAVLTSQDRKVCKHAKQLLADVGVHDVRKVYRVDVDCAEGDRIAYVNYAKQARTARFRKGPHGPVLDGISFGWPVI